MNETVLKQIADDIPDYKTFLTIDELHQSSRRLAEQFPGLASIRTVGQARSGEPIELLTISDPGITDPQPAFIFGGPHPNEPIGTMTLEYLTRRLCEDSSLRRTLGYTWHIIKSIDSDGMRLNEGWFKGPFTPTNYARHYFRPAPFDQVEWTFPISYKTLNFQSPMPETKALMAVIDEVKPRFMYSLHNSGFGGVYYYLTEQMPALYPLFADMPSWFGLALDLGEPESPEAEVYAPAIYKLLGIRDTYEHFLKNGVEDPGKVITAGTSSADYASKYGTATLIVEMPYFDDPRVNDQTPTDALRRTVILQNLDMQDEFDSWILAQLEAVLPLLKRETLVSRATQSFLKLGKTYRDAQRQWAQSSEETNRPATQAETFSNLLGSRFYRMLLLGMFTRMCAEEVEHGNDAVVQARDTAQARFEELGAALEADLNYRALPIRALVGVQTCAGLATAAHLNPRL